MSHGVATFAGLSLCQTSSQPQRDLDKHVLYLNSNLSAKCEEQ